MAEIQRTVSPVDGTVFVERPLATPAAVDRALHVAAKAWEGWRRTTLEQRAALCTAWVEAITAQTEVLADELTRQMGRPIRYSAGEIRGFADRGHTMIRLATSALAPIVPPEKAGFTRYVQRAPIGVVLVLAPWNYPWLTAVNAIVPALMAGNTVLLKHSDQTPLVAERLSAAALTAGIPDGVFQHIHMSHELTAGVVADPRVAYVAFTGSVEGGRAVHQAAGGRFKAVGLELGGKDPGYVRADANLDAAIDGLIDGAFFNSGQSCCGIERIYVHQSLYDRFVEGSVALVEKYLLDDPTRPDTTLGPVVRARNAAMIQAQVDEAVSRGARALIDAARFPEAGRRGAPYLAPQVLVGVDHTMTVMREETFGPVVGIMPVASDDEAIRLMNDSRYGLTAAIYSRDPEAAAAIGERLDTGTVFLNRCDYLDPELAWTGVKDSGRGCTLSSVGYESLTRPKSFHFRLENFMSQLVGNWNYPTTVRFGAGRITELPQACRDLGMTRPLLVTDRGLAPLPIVRDTVALLTSAGLPVGVFSDVHPNPTGDDVDNGLAVLRDGGHDGVIAFGGGSALDAAKAIALMAGQTRPLWDFEDRADWWTRIDPNGMVPVVAVPTTSGTGSEVGRASVILDESVATKKIIFHPKMLPGRVLCDPALTVGLPAHLTAATGIDALSHNLEAWCAPGFHPLADGVAQQGILLIQQSLLAAYKDGSDLDARGRMMAASLMGATAFQKGLGAMHSIAHVVGAHLHAHHGLLNAIVMPYVLVHNRPAIDERIAHLARSMGLAPTFDAFLAWVLEIRAATSTPHLLDAVGVTEAHVPTFAPLSVEDPSTGSNPRPMDAAAFESLYVRCLTGDLSAA